MSGSCEYIQWLIYALMCAQLVHSEAEAAAVVVDCGLLLFAK